MLNSLVKRVSGLPIISKVGLGVVSVAIAATAVGAATKTPDNPQPPQGGTGTSQGTGVKAEQTETKTVTTTEPVAFTSSTIKDGSLDQGKTIVQTAGVNGIKTITWQVTYANGVEASRVQTGAVVSTNPINEVVAQGTKAPPPSCPNGTYVNSAGNTVCSPYQSPSTPSGATAICRDGSYSFSQSRSGTCSHHGGVARWL